MKLKTKNANWPRLVAQWGVIAFILILAFFPSILNITTPDFEAYCPFGGLQALGSYLLSGALSCTMTSAQIVMGILLFTGIVLLSKLFCSYICPIGTISEWLGRLGDKLKIRFTIKGFADKALRSLKYILLFITLYFTLQSNELFCKKFDPYFGVASGFNSDVVILYVAISIALVVFGSIFIRLFWCKYLCPLGAISNIFKFTLFFAATLAVYLILLQLGVYISYVYPLAVACAGGYIIELTGHQKSKFFPVAKITRNTDSCIDCQLCSKKCPQAIDVASLKTVKHVDCNLCGDCLLVCPEKNTLTINKKRNWNRVPVIATVLLVILGITLGSVWEVPTIDERWEEPEVIENAAVFNQAGLKNIKCYGSSMAFANKMRNVEGVYGVATYVKHHRVKLYYNPEILNDEKIQELLFTPQKKPIQPLAKGIDKVYEVSLTLENFFDSFDFSYLSILLKQKTDAVGVISEYACPVIVKIYFPEEVKNEEELISILESETLTYETTAGESTVKLKYEVASKPEYKTITRNEYVNLLFSPYQSVFNKRTSYSNDVLNSYLLPLGKNRGLRSRFPYIVSHLSNDNGIVEFKTKLDSTMEEVAEIFYVDTLTNEQNIIDALLKDSLSITYTNGKTAKVKNMFDFNETLSASNQPENK
ncbi:4Fe-4S binding protein [Maribellus comscasis]|uniref:4Fe-4S binding protein n=1 Tax=Maribellus comscasis TaxID=2681766 RepID=A0A6I6JWN6_9BACT|nr:4Fe-4S binding protein [Maribellus comscasis]QGY45550.1 4Fe-4S binding protein [Maribellus comscasis]